ncbi:hypothetical protein [Treponema maltophilum]|jgi:hypothetical protein|uniref:hypothetical protein n=1 Tax=Treponema maltophilum TaxID=51160 RepID=UPI00361431EF
MQSVTICRFCGRTIDGEFVYCPWCGLSRLGGEQAFQNAPRVFERLEDIKEKGLSSRISKMEQSLDDIEQDLIRFMEAPKKR